MFKISKVNSQNTVSGILNAYFELTVTYTILVPLIVTIIFMRYYADYMLWAVPFISCCLTFFYGYYITTAKRILKPDSMLDIYMPVFWPFLWQLFLVILFNFCDWTVGFGPVIYVFLSFNWYGGYINEEWHNMIALNLVYNASIILGFTAGERFSAAKHDIKRKKLNLKRIGIVAICCILVYSLSEYVLYQKRINIVESEGYVSYGFRYEHGLSSIDLSPYYVENEENRLAKLSELSEFSISDPEEMPVLDGAEAAYPVYSAFAAACYENISDLQTTAKEQVNNRVKGKDEVIMPVQFHNSIVAYERLLSGETDIFFGARPSKEQIENAKMAGKELVLTPIGKEAFVFFVSSQNPIDELTAEQIRDIYSGKINNWHSLGGEKLRIQAFQRPKNSGSQTMMEYFMGDTPLREPLKVEYELSMDGVIEQVADYQNKDSSIGYSFRYYVSIMDADTSASNAGIKILAVDGLYPDEENIRNGNYPMTTELYAITLADNPNEHITQFINWMIGDQGQKIVSETGYVSIQ